MEPGFSSLATGLAFTVVGSSVVIDVSPDDFSAV
jgi:hypothetical protein